jgi:HEAT repeat protein
MKRWSLETTFEESSDSEISTRVAAINALGHLKKDEPKIVNALLSSLSDSSWLVRKETVTALERLDKDQPQRSKWTNQVLCCYRTGRHW